MSQTAGNISEEELQQLLRTVEMFEAITEAQPEDYQSLEILKEAYGKLGRRPDHLRVSRMLAMAYQKLGHVSQAILECEGILEEHSADTETQGLLAGLQNVTALAHKSEKLELGAAKPSGATEPADASSGGALRQQAADGDRLLANLLIVEKVATQQALDPLLVKLQGMRVAEIDRNQPLSLIHQIVNEQFAKLEDLLAVLLDKTNLPYLPLSIYDVDRDVASLLPLELSWQHCLVPFDAISRSVLVATANPFDMQARMQVERLLKRNVFWYVSPPAEIAAALRRVHGLDNTKGPQTAS